MPVGASNLDISVAMATYNGGRYIRDQLESLRTQTRHPTELVVTDDGSSDDTIGQIEHFAATAPFPVKIVRNETRLGWRGNFIKAAGLCRGGLIAFCDQDDIWYPRKLETLGPLFLDERVLLAYHDANIVDQAGDIIGTLRFGESDVNLMPPRARPTTWSNPLGLTLMFRQDLTRFIPYWPASVDPRHPTMPAAHDQWFYYLASNLGHIAFTQERLLGYRQHGSNTVGFAAPSRSVLGASRETRLATDYMATLAAFCRALDGAQRDGLDAHFPELSAARDTNERLLDRLERQHAAQHDRGLTRRLAHFGSLLHSHAYSRRTPWNLGYRACLRAALVGVPFGR